MKNDIFAATQHLPQATKLFSLRCNIEIFVNNPLNLLYECSCLWTENDSMFRPSLIKQAPHISCVWSKCINCFHYEKKNRINRLNFLCATIEMMLGLISEREK